MDEQEDKRYITMAEIMTPEKANFGGNIHGGHILQLCDRVAYACASRYSGHYVVTLSVDQVLFKRPIHVGELVTCYAMINYVGKTSMEVGIKIISENLITQERRHTNSCFYTMVAVNKKHKPVKVQPLTLNNDIQKRRFEEAKARKEIATKMAQEHRQRKLELKKEFNNH